LGRTNGPEGKRKSVEKPIPGVGPSAANRVGGEKALLWTGGGSNKERPSRLKAQKKSAQGKEPMEEKNAPCTREKSGTWVKAEIIP